MGNLTDILQFSEDFSNYWTAVLYYRAANGTFKRVPQKPNAGFEQANGGMTVYYTPTVKNGALKKGEITAFKKGFRMIVGMRLGLISTAQRSKG
jgi:hypothetical protein